MLDPTRSLPPAWVAQAREFADGSRTPVEPRNAATVVLSRSAEGSGDPGSLELYFLRRHVDMAFAAGMAVFPGGGVDSRDHDEPADALPWAGPPAEHWAQRLGVEPGLARALVYAAARETFEESGVLLAGPSPGEVVDDTTGDDWESDRRALEGRELSFTEFLRKRGLVVRSDLLTPWACWVTPVFEPRRYRTWFFLAALPNGQRTRDVSSESEEVMWLPVREALRAAHEDRLLMLPPQYCTCLELFDAASPAEAARIGRERELALVEPTARFYGDEAHLEIPERLVTLGEQVRSRMDR
jgi:8-oxo-dGTP pyrophosphatase MutT (NUDIX family)